MIWSEENHDVLGVSDDSSFETRAGEGFVELGTLLVEAAEREDGLGSGLMKLVRRPQEGERALGDGIAVQRGVEGCEGGIGDVAVEIWFLEQRSEERMDFGVVKEGKRRGG